MHCRGSQRELSFDSKIGCWEIALGASSQHIIVEDEAAATRAIDFQENGLVGLLLPHQGSSTSRSKIDPKLRLSGLPGFGFDRPMRQVI